MGEVWAARNELTNRDFAIKFLLPEFTENSEAYERFVREAKTTGRLQHQSIVDVYDVALGANGRPFIVMELLHGEELEALIERKGPLSPLKAAVYFAQIAAALQQAHDEGIVHRDLSTNNIFLARAKDGAIVPKILDFGVSKTFGPAFDIQQTVTCNGAVLGNPIFMSPEQARGADGVDHRTDIWALGVSMYMALTGHAPFSSENYNALMVDIMTHEHRPIRQVVPALDKELAVLIESCLVKDRDQRVNSAAELAFRLGEIARRFVTDPKELGRTPRRRVTDLLPTLDTPALEQTGSPLGVRLLGKLGIPVPSRAVVGVLACAIGIGFGFQAKHYLAPQTPVVIQAAAPESIGADKVQAALSARAALDCKVPGLVQPTQDGLGAQVTAQKSPHGETSEAEQVQAKSSAAASESADLRDAVLRGLQDMPGQP